MGILTLCVQITFRFFLLRMRNPKFALFFKISRIFIIKTFQERKFLIVFWNVIINPWHILFSFGNVLCKNLVFFEFFVKPITNSVEELSICLCMESQAFKFYFLSRWPYLQHPWTSVFFSVKHCISSLIHELLPLRDLSCFLRHIRFQLMKGIFILCNLALSISQAMWRLY